MVRYTSGEGETLPHLTGPRRVVVIPSDSQSGDRGFESHRGCAVKTEARNVAVCNKSVDGCGAPDLAKA